MLAKKNLSRVTVMVLRRMNDVWGFLGAEVVDGKLVAGAIPRLDGKTSHLFNPESMDCVNCHIAQAAREYLTEKLSASVDQNLFSAFKYTNSNYNLENKSAQVFNTHQLRGVGYFGVDLAMSQLELSKFFYSSGKSLKKVCQGTQ